MDALAHDRQARGLPALSINWGIWSVIGSAAARKADEWMLSQGVGTISPEHGLEMLDTLFAQEKAQIAVLPINWVTYLSQFKTPPLWLSALAEEARKKGKRSSTATTSTTQKPSAKMDTQEFRQKLASVPPNQQRQFLLEHVHAQVVKAIGLEAGQEIDPRQALNELGLDSLMAVELRNMLSNSLKLERNLPATLVFDYPTINALTDYLAQDILKLEIKKEEKKVTPAAKTDVLKDIESLSDEEVAKMLSDLK
jgi:acyl carrier protein